MPLLMIQSETTAADGWEQEKEDGNTFLFRIHPIYNEQWHNKEMAVHYFPVVCHNLLWVWIVRLLLLLLLCFRNWEFMKRTEEDSL